jgi:hypothetical protein
VKPLLLGALLFGSASLALLVSASTGGVGPCLRFCLYDPTGGVSTEVTRADVVLSSVRAVRQPGGQAALYLRLTPRGASRLHSLTRALAHRGARLHRQQSFAVRIGGRVRARTRVDYRAFPQGLDGNSGLEILTARLAVIQQLAKEIRM